MKVHRDTIPIDGQPHELGLTGKIVHVDAKTDFDKVDVWHEWTDDAVVPITVQVFGTGHPIPDLAKHLGTALAGPYVWHLYELRVT